MQGGIAYEERSLRAVNEHRSKQYNAAVKLKTKIMQAVYYQAVIPTPISKLGIIIAEDKLAAIHFLDKASSSILPQTTLAKNITEQLKAYFNQQAFNFDFPILFAGTEFQQAVWLALSKIPMRKTITYGELAKQMASGPRAIGNACRNNPIPIIIPCHRVLAKNHLGGYLGKRDGEYFSIKQKLLAHEGYAEVSFE